MNNDQGQLTTNESFGFYIDNKQIIWERSYYVVKAETEEKAIQKMREIFNDPDSSDAESSFSECETLYDTAEYLIPETNNGDVTRELWSNNKLIMNNKEG